MAGKKGNDYFEMLSELVDYSCEAASLLNDTLLNFNINEIERRIEEMHKIEHTADVKKQSILKDLVMFVKVQLM